MSSEKVEHRNAPDASAGELDAIVDRILALAATEARRIAQGARSSGREVEALSEVELYCRRALEAPESEPVELERPPSDTRLARLVETFGLGPVDLAVLQTCVAARVSARVRRALANLHEDVAVSQVNESLVARLFGLERPLLSPESALLRWGFVRRRAANGPERWLECDPVVLHWLAGRDELDEALVGQLSVVPAREPLASWPVEEVASDVERRLDIEGVHAVRVWIVGPPGSGKKTLAACVSARLGLGAMGVEPAQAAGSSDRIERIYRQAFWDRYAPIWRGEPPERRPAAVAAFPVEFVVVERLSGRARRGSDVVVEMPPLDAASRRRLWRTWIPGADEWDEEQLDLLASRRSAQPRDILEVAESRPDTAVRASHLLSVAQRGRLEPLAGRVECPFQWDDLVVSEELGSQLERLLFEATQRDTLLETPDAERLFSAAGGLVALFAGPPGTGKTMAAQVLAGELQRDLYRVDLSQLISKYIGETMKHLSRLMERAASLDAILLFDEADALFAQRTEVRDAHDRHANTDTNFLLQTLEQYRGIALLTSNKRHQLDAAFTRRFRYILEFESPGPKQRALIWRRLVEALTGIEEFDEALDDGLEVLAGQVDLTGAEIKAAVLTAIFRARRSAEPLGAADLVAGVQAELTKAGRAMSQRQYDRLLEEVRR